MKRTVLILASLTWVIPTMTAQASKSIIDGAMRRSVISTPILHLSGPAINTYTSNERHNKSPESQLTSCIIKKNAEGGNKDNGHKFKPRLLYVAAFSTLITGGIMAEEQDQREKVTYLMPSEQDIKRLFFSSKLSYCFLHSSGIFERLAGRKLSEVALLLEIKLAIDNYRNRLDHYLECLENSDCGRQMFALTTDKESIEQLNAVIREELDAIKDEEKIRGIISSQLEGYRSDYKITEDEWQRYLNLHDRWD